MNILLIGTGPMAVDYAKVLKEISEEFIVVGRGEKSANRFNEETGINPVTGGIDKYLEENEIPKGTKAIVAVGTEALMEVLLALKNNGVTDILIEKPAAISISELLANKSELEAVKDSVFVAYNRRFYASVMEAERLIKEDGGLQSMHFEFTEWAHKIEPLQKAEGVKENWFFANSTHVVDLAFYLAGEPTSWAAFSKEGELSWHEKTNFSGAGITNKGVVFSYISNWESAGRWGIELMTSKRRIYLKPMEGLSVQLKGTIAIVEHEFEKEKDQLFKPGLYAQTKVFIEGYPTHRLVSLKEQLNNALSVYQKILT